MPLTTSTSAITVGIPAGVDPENVRSRKAALVSAGMPDALAEGVATVAAHQQHLRDTRQKETPVIVEKSLTEQKVAIKKEAVKKLPASHAPKKVPMPGAADPTAAAGAP